MGHVGEELGQEREDVDVAAVNSHRCFARDSWIGDQAFEGAQMRSTLARQFYRVEAVDAMVTVKRHEGGDVFTHVVVGVTESYNRVVASISCRNSGACRTEIYSKSHISYCSSRSAEFERRHMMITDIDTDR